MSRNPLAVVCAVLRAPSGRILATQRPPEKALPLAWEFPGGKIEPGESPEKALRRELHEELDLEVGELTPLPIVFHHDQSCRLQLIPFLTILGEDSHFSLLVHVNARWIIPSDWKQLDWAPADVPVIQNLLQSKDA